MLELTVKMVDGQELYVRGYEAQRIKELIDRQGLAFFTPGSWFELNKMSNSKAIRFVSIDKVVTIEFDES
ncbi:MULTISPECIES: hypothetical protein [Bacillus]|uniref:hypothetical protein n=1 Tax=Bacillus TaxID=1386 RepID=UPI0001A1841A|nr:hypothetical protein [Bacillus pseudomycoides]EEM13708.1 hypothetical protein bpmyx0001_54540 [Bacillus pseudomycoides DSM 12442]MED1594525.1 hypothetical protein [Bacillus pseudomycoides]OOR46861.1 hypothetical protein BLX05_30590 [Bacillus pseudomycoides]PDY09441.1 hypothetical protein COO16_25840 [Bacillus pseudomycoides]PEU30860.1 hypothetical protein CN535_28695 [Bacillus pseudomycoides]